MSLTHHKDESGLTTLEWLLIVAAVAGLAALAVVLVQNVVNDTAEQIAGSSARQTAAIVAAQQIVDEAIEPPRLRPLQTRLWPGWVEYYNKKCARIEIIYGDVISEVLPMFKVAEQVTFNGRTVYMSMPRFMLSADSPTSDPPDLVNGQAVAHCQVVL